jgi:hypothetical protein
MLYLGIDQHRKQLTVSVRNEAGLETDRVALGGCPPRAPTDPNVRN